MSELEKLYAQYQPRRFYQGGLNDEANPTDLPVVSAPEPEPAQNVQQLAARYEPAQASTMWNDYMDARQRVKQENAALRQALERHMTEQPVDKSEMYFRLAAALAAPTKTQGISEPLSRAAEALAESRAGERKERQANMLKALEARQALAQLSEKEASDIGQLYNKYAQGNESLTTLSKNAIEAGLVRGTPEYQAFMKNGALQSGDLALQRIAIAQAGLQNAQTGLDLKLKQFEEQRKQNAKLTGPEVKLKEETENLISNADQALIDLNKAYKLNPNTFDTSVPDTVQRKALELSGSKDEKLKNTRLLENLLSEQALEKLRTTFGGNPTEGERGILLQLQGIGAKSKEERKDIIMHAYQALKDKKAMHIKRLNEINQGLYRTTTPSTPDLGE